ncbi:MAG: hypothetical protein GY788_13260, partial [bacterium]|nr:hypothetical protein [bacterium]
MVTITHAGADDATVNTILNSAVFDNTSNNDPSTTARTVTLTSVTDSGSGTTADGTIATVNVAKTNDTPTLAASAANDTLTENTDVTSGAVFNTVTIDPIESGDDIVSAQLTIGGGRGSVNYHDVSLSVFDQTAATTAGGSVTNNGDGTVDYTPAGNYTGADSFNYIITDGEGNLASAPVSVTVNGVNDTPTLAASAANDTLTENTDVTSGAVFNTVTIDPIESGDDIVSA